MADALSVFSSALGLSTAIQAILSTLQTLITDRKPSVQELGSLLQASNTKDLLDITGVKIRRWKALWLQAADKNVGELVASGDDDLAILWGLQAVRNVKEMLFEARRKAIAIDKLISDAVRTIRECDVSLTQKRWKAYLRADINARSDDLCAHVQGLELLCETAFRQHSCLAEPVESTRDDLRAWFGEVSSHRKGLHQFIDLCSKTDLSVSVQIATGIGKTGDIPVLDSRPPGLLVMCENYHHAFSGDILRFLVSTRNEACAKSATLPDSGVMGGMEQVLALIDVQHQGQLNDTCFAVSQVDDDWQQFAIRRWDPSLDAEALMDECSHSTVRWAHLPLAQELVPLSISEKVLVACNLAHHALMLLGTTWASCFTTTNLRRRGCPKSRAWKLYVQGNLRLDPATRQAPEAVLASQIVDFGLLLLGIAAGCRLVDSSMSLFKLATDVMPTVERLMGARYSAACLFCLNAPTYAAQCEGPDAVPHMLHAFHSDVYLPLERLQRCLSTEAVE